MDYTMRYLKNKNLNKIVNKNHQAPKWRNRKEQRTSTGGPFPTTLNYYSIFNHRKPKANLAFKNGDGGGGRITFPTRIRITVDYSETM